MTEGHLGEEELVDLALFDLDQARAEAVTRHLGACESCHLRYAAIWESAELVLAAAPRVAPPPGFSGSVLTAMGFDEQPAARPPRRAAVLLAVAALFGVLAGAAGVLVLQAIAGPETVESSAAGVAITTSEGQQVGTMGDSWYEDQPVYVITVTGGGQDVNYHCDLLLADGGRVPGGSWQLPAGATSTWIVDQPVTAAVGMELVTDSGHVWASATLPG